jgi:hypothetical protein
MRLVLFIMIVVVAGSLSACRGDVDTRGAEEAVRARIEQLSRGDYAAAWETLHPAHQAIVSQEKFVECGRELQLRRDPTVDTIAILESRQTSKEIAGIGEVEVVNVQVEQRTGEEARRPTYDVIEVDGTWRWVLSDAALNAFQAGNCPS